MGNSNEYMNVYMKARYIKRRQQAINLLGRTCVVCGSTKGLEIDHINRASKSFSISKMWSISEDAYLSELKKCQLLCYKHHKEKSSGEMSVQHGGGVSGKRNCSCDLCKAKKSEYNRNYKILYL